jgi:AhpD family alkylhydroperoxidase
MSAHSTDTTSGSLDRYQQFQAYRTKMNARILGASASPTQSSAAEPPADHAAHAPIGATLNMKRFFRLDGACYEDGHLPRKTKELLGLVASMVLRCDDCIAYHIDQCIGCGVTDEEFFETFDVALIVGGSIVIPHLRRGVEFLDVARQHTSR